jgi:hypothetical protein
MNFLSGDTEIVLNFMFSVKSLFQQLLLLCVTITTGLSGGDSLSLLGRPLGFINRSIP